MHARHGKMHVPSVTAQERNCHVSTEEVQGCAPPLNCWLMTPLPQEVMMGSLHHVAETATVPTAGVAAAACVACAALLNLVKLLIQVTYSMHFGMVVS